MKFVLILLGVLFSCTVGFSGEIRTQVELVGESRFFTDDNEDKTEDQSIGLAAIFEAKQKKKNFRWKLRGFARRDIYDQQRSVSYLEDAWVDYRIKPFKFRAGYEVLNWSATEAFHPSDIINSTNYDAGFQSVEKIGELLISVKANLGKYNLMGLYFPLRTAPHMPDGRSRMSSLPAGTKLDKARWIEPSGKITEDARGDSGGLAIEHDLFGADLHWHLIRHWDRKKPQFGIDIDTGNLYPVYFPVTEAGFTLQKPLGNSVFKVEVGNKSYETIGNHSSGFNEPDDYSLVALGIDFGMNHESGSETELILEYQRLIGLSKSEAQSAEIFQNDILLGFRFVNNDVDDFQVISTAIIDLEEATQYVVTAKMSARLNDQTRVSLYAQVVEAERATEPEGLERMRNSDYFSLNLRYYF